MNPSHRASDQQHFSVVWHDESPGLCCACGAMVGAGPSGWLSGSGPLCDPCLLEHAHDLGVMLQAANVMRELADAHSGADEHDGEFGKENPLRDEALIALMTYARMYERLSTERWPYRPVGLLVYLRHLTGVFESIDWNEAPDAVVPGGNGKR